MKRGLTLLLSLSLLACGGEPAADPALEPGAPTVPTVPTVPNAPTEPTAPPEPAGPTCAERIAASGATISAAADAHRACEFDNECIPAAVATACAAPCPTAIHPRGVPALDAARAAEDEGRCADLEECDRPEAECARATPRCVDGACAMDEGDPPLREVEVPAANALGQDSPPPRPPPGEPEQERARRLFAAIVADAPELAQDFFFPREAFARVKAMASADAYWQRLFARYAVDVHALHEALGPLDGEAPEFVRLDIIRRGGWVPRGEEGNALPYWVSRHSRLVYRVGDAERTLEVRVLITWGARWYITHLSEFH